MNYSECLTFLAQLGHELRGVTFDLEAITKILAGLGDPHRRYRTAIVAGTNGKGSTAAVLASILQRAGYRTGLYTSPHLIRVNERIAVNAAEVPDEDFARAFTLVAQTVDRLLEENRLEHRPSFFEYLTATAFQHFATAQVDFAVLEVGMGGRLDATNVTDPSVAVITNIDLDHQEFLGTTRAAIAGEKAAVIRPHRPVVSTNSPGEAAEVIRRRCAELGAPLIETASFTRLDKLRSVDGRYTFDLSVNGDFFHDLTSPLLGRFQVENVVAAVCAAQQLSQEGLKIPRPAFHVGVREAAWPGRLEVVARQPLVLLDGAHNPGGAREVAGFVKNHLQGRPLRLVYASMRDKAMGEISGILFPLAEEIYLTRPKQARAAAPEEILAAAGQRAERTVIEPDPARALELAVRASPPEGMVLACGSLFLVGAIKEAIATGRIELVLRAEQAVIANT
jgi:dihydrofolate synthase/folylpolyglutamate synthase